MDVITARSRELRKCLGMGSFELSRFDRKLPPALHYFHGATQFRRRNWGIFPLEHRCPGEVPGDLLDPGPQSLDVRENVGVRSGDGRGFWILTLALAAENTMQLPHAAVVAAH